MKDKTISEASKAFEDMNPEMENMQMGYGRQKHQKALQQLLNEIYDKSLNLPHIQFHVYYSKIQQLHQLFEDLPCESINYQGDLPISFAYVEKVIAKYIFECLQGSREQNLDIDQILNLIQDYKVVQLHPRRNPSVSLERVHTILEDNFQDSSLYKLLELLLNGSQGTKAKVITFY